MFWRALRALPLAWRQRRKVLERVRNRHGSLLMVSVLSFFIGGVIALQTGPVLVEHGLASAVGGVVGIAMAGTGAGDDGHPDRRAHRLGHGGGNRLDAGLSGNQRPAHHEHQPDPLPGAARLLAIVFALPMLVIFAILVGWFGGAVVAESNHHIGIPFQVFFVRFARHRGPKDVANGVFKSFCFALIMAWSPAQGLTTWAGRAASAVGDKGGGQLHRADRILSLRHHLDSCPLD